MSRIVASAPGKAMICGEYAVLQGAPAIVAALDRRAVVRIEPSSGGRSSLTTIGYLDGERAWTLRGNAVEWADPGVTGMTLFEIAVAASPAPAGDVAVAIDTSAFRDAATGRKLGLGSSAAATVALVAALDPDAEAAERYARAMEVHRAFQDGRGSGFDIAAAQHGGILHYVRGLDPEPLSWPAGLHARFFWTGESASTGRHLRRREDRTRDEELDSLCTAAEAVASDWATGSAAAVLAAMRDYAVRLRQFDRSSGIGIFAGGHGALAERAAQYDDVVYKPCGAGGGDTGVALAPAPESLDAFSDDARGTAASVLDVAIDTQGVAIEDSEQ